MRAGADVSQQIGGSIGTALLSTLAASAATGYVANQGASHEVLRAAAVEGYTTAFWWAAGVFAIGALVCGSLFRPGARPELAHGAAEPAPAPS